MSLNSGTSEAWLCRRALIRDFLDYSSIDHDVGLKIHCVQKYPDSVGVRHSPFKNAIEVLEPAVVDYHLVTGLEFIGFHEAITSNLRSHQFNDLVSDYRRLIVERDQTMDSPGVTHLVIVLVVSETTEDITREQRLHNLS